MRVIPAEDRTATLVAFSDGYANDPDSKWYLGIGRTTPALPSGQGRFLEARQVPKAASEHALMVGSFTSGRAVTVGLTVLDEAENLPWPR
jgi:hypothetical protein